MGFREIQNIQLSYNTLTDDVVADFYVPCLRRAVKYKRAVGFFSSGILLRISQGLGAFADNGGKMQLLVSPRLEPADYDAIERGYGLKLEDYVAEKINKEFDFDSPFDQKNDRYGMLSYMISSGLLDIKIVALERNNDSAMFHRKVGVLEDENGDYIAFSGSGNETPNGYMNNDEDFEVYCSWKSDESEGRCSKKEMEFNQIWNGHAKGLVTIPFPEAVKNKILSFKSREPGTFAVIDEEALKKRKSEKNPTIPKQVKFYDYQLKAIDNWVSDGFKGVFDMATGTGKTFTGAGAICRLFETKKRLVVFVCCPFTHLVDQWCDELAKFGIDGVKCYGGTGYEKKLERELLKFSNRRTNFVCAVITNASFSREAIQKLIPMNLKSTLLLVDEAHNFGATEISKTMALNYPYRLALSATFERHGDKEGTKKLFDFFGQKCIEYTLDRAICEGKLTPYKYYPVLVPLNDDEYDKYVDLSKKIARCVHGGDELSDYAKALLIKRARIVAGTEGKITALEEILKRYKGDSNMLVYCGAVKYGEIGYEKDEQGLKQISRVLSLLNTKLGFYASKFTGEEDAKERGNILEAFKRQEIQALVAIKCLDEGLNVPSIKTAFILASSTNPKEYVQRRGRVLRKAPGKEYAEIYDFITLPKLHGDSISNPNLAIDKNLVRKELNRVIDFANMSKNPSDSNAIIAQIKSDYGMDVYMNEEDQYE